MTKYESAPIEKVEAQAYRIPTEQPESDGTLVWDSTTMVVVHVHAADVWGLGYTYADAALVPLIREKLAKAIIGLDASAVPHCRLKMLETVRNLGRSGLAVTAAAALDIALWDLKAKLFGVPLVTLLGQVRDKVPVYGSGGFTSYTDEQLSDQLTEWVAQGMQWVKMKIGRNPHDDPRRVRQARAAIETKTGLFVDANGACDRKQALCMAEYFVDYGVSWLEEPVYHRDLEGLRLLRDRAPACMEIASGEYGQNIYYYRNLIQAQAVDVIQVDATRFGISGFLQAAALCEAHNLPLSSHTAPSVHLHPACALGKLRHMEYFHDHVRIENMLFDGVARPHEGTLAPSPDRPGLGLEFKAADGKKYEVTG